MGPDEQEEEQPEKTSEAWNTFKARIFFCAGRVSEHPIWRKTMALVIGPAQALMSNCIAYVVRNNPKDYIKIMSSVYFFFKDTGVQPHLSVSRYRVVPGKRILAELTFEMVTRNHADTQGGNQVENIHDDIDPFLQLDYLPPPSLPPLCLILAVLHFVLL